MQFTARPRRSLVAPLAAAVLGACTAPALAAPTPGGASIGDSLYPTLGNSGYSALHYNVDLSFGANPTDVFTGSVSLIGKAGKDLSSFSVDYSGTTVGNVSVDGASARFTIGGDKLVVFPKKAIAKDAKFTVRFGGFSAEAAPADGGFLGASVALASGSTGLFTAGQTQYAHSWFPSNDTPADKASYTFTLTTPANRVAVANGVLVKKEKLGGRLRWIYQMQQPMATELIQMAVGDYSIIDRGKVGGVQIRDVVANTPATQRIGGLFGVEKDQLRYMTAKVGPYPFDAYGSLSTDAELGFALETQTLSIFDPVIFDPNWEYYSEGYWKATMLHELAHQWFGDSVAPRDWADIWLNEGHATWYETTWAAENGYLLDDTFVTDDFDELNRSYYSLGDQFRADYGPVGRPLSGADDDVFSNQAYIGGQLVLYALRQKIGKARFEQLEREWVAKYRNGNARTGDYIRLASEVSGRDLTKFLKDWIYGTKTPPMPGHPDWTVDLVVTNTATSRVASASVPATAGMRADGRRR